MQLNTLVVILLILRVAAPLKFGEIQYPVSCPKVKFITDLDFSSSIGFWYRCFSTLDSSLCFNNEGQTVYAYPYDSSVAGVAICCRSAANPELVTCSAEVGTGLIKAMQNPGTFSYEFNGQAYTTVVLDMNDDFLISYSCKSKSHRGSNEKRDEQIYIYARSYQQCESMERRFRNVLKQNGIPWSRVKPVKHGSSIPYTTVPKPCPKN